VDARSPFPNPPLVETPFNLLVALNTTSHPATLGSSVVADIVPEEPIVGAGSMAPQPEMDTVYIAQQAPRGRRTHGRSLSDNRMTPRWYSSWPDSSGRDHGRFPNQRSYFDHEAGVQRLSTERRTRQELLGIVFIMFVVLLVIMLILVLFFSLESSRSF
jgi:hypothetical protein